MDISLYDGLALVHPDLDTPTNPKPFNQRYRKNLVEAVYEFMNRRKPIFLVDGSRQITADFHKILLVEAIPLPVFEPRHNYAVVSQKEVDFVAEKIGKNPEDIFLAFGGLWAHACVYACAKNWCDSVITNHPSDWYEFTRANKRLKQGKVLDEII